MIKSLHIIGSRLLGGAESFYMRLALALHDGGYPTIAMNRQDSQVAKELQGKIPLVHGRFSNPWDLITRNKVSRIIKVEQPDIVQTYMTRATVLTHLRSDSKAVHIARLGGFYKIKRFAHAHAWVGNTQAICDYLINGGMPADKVFYIGNFVDRPVEQSIEQKRSLAQSLGLPDDALVIMSIGRMIEKKGFQDLLPAFAGLPAEIKSRPLHLLLVGDGPMRMELEQSTHQLGIGGRVHFTGWQTSTSPYYSLADIFVCPSRHEPLGNVILEAWSHSLPVVSTDSHGAIELIEDGQNGVLSPCHDAKALSQRLLNMLGADESLRHQLGCNGYETVEKNYRPEAVTAAYLQLYRHLLDQR